MSLELITDRTQADYEEWLKLSQIPWDKMTPEQKAKWSVPMKGAYNYTDLNRVGEAILALQSILAGYGYSVEVDVRTDYTLGEWPTKSEMDAYVQSIANMRAVLAVLPTTPDAPESMDDGTIIVWNNIEIILRDVEMLITNMAAAFRHSGTFCSGQGGLIL